MVTTTPKPIATAPMAPGPVGGGGSSGMGVVEGAERAQLGDQGAPASVPDQRIPDESTVGSFAVGPFVVPFVVGERSA